jgi:flagellar biosynthesis component FlhA
MILYQEKEAKQVMKKIKSWQILAVIFAVFWILFAIVLIVTGFPFYIISIALTTIALLSVLVTVLAWAYQNNF